MTFASIRWANAERTALRAERADGSVKVIEAFDSDLWAMAHASTFGAIGDYVPPAPMPLPAFQKLAVEQVNAAAGALRLGFVTAIPGQEMLYLAKEAEAKAYVAATMPDIDDYPLIAAEVGITADDAAGVAAEWLAKAAQWRGIAAAIEQERLGAIKLIETAADHAGVMAAAGAAETGLQALARQFGG